MKIAFFKEIITPEVGAYLAGYSLNDKSVMKLDELYAAGLCIDDGNSKVLLISLDLIGLDESYIREVRTRCAEILSIPESAVMISPTHTHTGPESRTLPKKPEQIHKVYLENLKKILYKATENLKDFRECNAYFYSAQCDENRSRRYVTADNCATFTPHRREVVPCATGFADKELGILIFRDPENGLPLYVIGNYAAHPLAGHSPGLGGLRISADYPGAFRDYILAETGAEAMFISGAAGDMVPREDELGSDAAKGMGMRLAKGALGGMIDAPRNPARFLMKDAKVGSSLTDFTVPMRKRYRPKIANGSYSEDGKNVTLQIQCIAIGDVCFVGVPGELCAELGQEIKWHSPFRRTYIAYDATAYFDYMGPANFLVAGGYEGNAQKFTAKGGLVLVNTAVDALFALREELYPSEDTEDPYPDCCVSPLVNIPENWEKK